MGPTSYWRKRETMFKLKKVYFKHPASMPMLATCTSYTYWLAISHSHEHKNHSLPALAAISIYNPPNIKLLIGPTEAVITKNPLSTFNSGVDQTENNLEQLTLNVSGYVRQNQNPSVRLDPINWHAALLLHVVPLCIFKYSLLVCIYTRL